MKEKPSKETEKEQLITGREPRKCSVSKSKGRISRRECSIISNVIICYEICMLKF